MSLQEQLENETLEGKERIWRESTFEEVDICRKVWQRIWRDEGERAGFEAGRRVGRREVIRALNQFLQSSEFMREDDETNNI